MDLLSAILEAKRIKREENKERNRPQEEIVAFLKGESYKKTNLEILSVSEEGIITLKRNKRIYKIRKVDRDPKRWDFIFFKEGDYKGPWFKENCGNFFLIKKNDGHVYFDDLKGFDCYLGIQYCDTYEVIERI